MNKNCSNEQMNKNLKQMNKQNLIIFLKQIRFPFLIPTNGIDTPEIVLI